MHFASVYRELCSTKPNNFSSLDIPQLCANITFECRSALISLNLSKHLCAFILLVLAGMRGAGPSSIHGLQAFPRLTLWAWERREDLRFVSPANYAIAYLDQTILLWPNVTSVPRSQPLWLPVGTRLTAVVRIEGIPYSQDDDTASSMAKLVLISARRPGVSALQIDFDAKYSQHSLYRALLEQVRAALPKDMPLSITALASWCGRDSWLADLPIDEAVPMFFRMGNGAHPAEPGWDYPLYEPKCMTSAGVSMDEAWPHINGSQRIYVFHPRAWNPVALRNLELLIKP